MMVAVASAVGAVTAAVVLALTAFSSARVNAVHSHVLIKRASAVSAAIIAAAAEKS